MNAAGEMVDEKGEVRGGVMPRYLTVDEHRNAAGVFNVTRGGLVCLRNAIFDFYGRGKAGDHVEAALEHLDLAHAAMEGKLSSESGDGKLASSIYYPEVKDEKEEAKK